MSSHAACRIWRSVIRESEWRSAGRFVERTIERQRVCAECGLPRAVRVRRISAVQRKAATLAPLVIPEQRALAARLVMMLRQRRRLKVASLSKRLGGVKIELSLEALAETAPLLLTYKAHGDHRPLEWVETSDLQALEEIARPGLSKRRAEVLIEARSTTSSLTHPEAVMIAEILKSERASELDDRVVRVLAALARLIHRGDIRPARAFSTEVLGDSKALASVRARIERLVGPLERLGIRDTGSAVLIGGRGKIAINAAPVDISSYRYLGFASQDLDGASILELPAQGVLVVENLTAFHSCIEQLASQPVMIVWSGGFPSAGVLRVLQLAAAMSARIRVWCDLDLGGVRIARLIHEHTKGLAQPALMSPELVTSALVFQPLSSDQTSRIKRDLETRPTALLGNTLRALLERSAWVEQEALLDLVPSLASV